MIIFTLALSSMAIAEDGMKAIGDYGKVKDGLHITSSPSFSFVDPLQSGKYEVTAKYISSTRTYMVPEYGSRCDVGEYITLLACEDSAGKTCYRFFKDDYQKKSDSDRLDISQYENKDWFQSTKADRFMAYECRRPTSGSTGGTTTTDSTTSTQSFSNPQNYGRVLEVNAPSEIYAGETVRVTGKYKAAASSDFILESTIDPTTRTPFAVVEGSDSPCDGSAYVGGSKVDGTAGTTYSYDFTYKAPNDPGDYKLVVHAWTDCFNRGGKFIDSYRKDIKVKERNACNPMNAAKTVYQDMKFNTITGAFTQFSGTYIKSCTEQQVLDYCGDKDTDGDGVNDGCDYCPKQKGSKTADALGCHPCFGKSVESDCWDNYEDKYGIPAEVEKRRNPIVGSETRCNGDTLQNCNVREDGTHVNCEDSRQCDNGCENGECVGKSITDKEIKCYNGDLYQFVYFSDDTEDKHKIKPCEGTCEGGQCVASETKDGGNPDASDEKSRTIGTDSSECSVDSDCSTNEYCDSQTGTCVPHDKSEFCTSDSDCNSNQICSTGSGLCLDEDSIECSSDSDCANGETCFSNFCMSNETEYTRGGTTTSCTEDQTDICQNGEEIVTAKCVNNELQPLNNHCPEATENGGRRAGGDTVVIGNADTGMSQQQLIFLGIAGLVVVGAAGYYYYTNYYNQSKKGRKKRR